MKRSARVASFLLFLALCASVTYWAMQLLKPSPRAVAASAPKADREMRLEAASGLFGSRRAPVAVAENYVLKGVMVARDPGQSVAILAADGKPAQAIGVGLEVSRGVTVKEVHPGYVLLSDSGVERRVALPERGTARDKAAK